MNIYLILAILILILIYLNDTDKVYFSFPIDKDATNLFWTGGFDSTFRLCQLLIDEKKKVQPVYISDKDVDAPFWNGNQHRKSIQKEIDVMDNIRQTLHRDYPYTEKLLLPTIYVHRVKFNCVAYLKAIYIHYVLGQFARVHTQYERMARFSLYYPATIEVGLDKCGTGLDRATKDHAVGNGADRRVKDGLSLYYRPLDIFKKFRLPIAHLDKKDMLEISRERDYEYILKKSWSCWLPKKNGSPCGRCKMCRERILPQVNITS